MSLDYFDVLKKAFEYFKNDNTPVSANAIFPELSEGDLGEAQILMEESNLFEDDVEGEKKLFNLSDYTLKEINQSATELYVNRYLSDTSESGGGETSEELQEYVIKRCLEEIEKRGYVRLGYVIVKIAHTYQPRSFYKSIAYKLTYSGKYIKEPHKDGSKDFDISPNPNYELSEITKRTSRVQRKVLILTIGVSILTLIATTANIIITNQSNREKQINLQEQLKNLKLPTILIDSVVVHHHSKDSLSKTRTTY